MNEKIIQIIPAPADLWAVYAKETNEPLSEGGVCRVACLALMEDGETGRVFVSRWRWNYRLCRLRRQFCRVHLRQRPAARVLNFALYRDFGGPKKGAPITRFVMP